MGFFTFKTLKLLITAWAIISMYVGRSCEAFRLGMDFIAWLFLIVF